MNDSDKQNRLSDNDGTLSKKVGSIERHKLNARKKGLDTVWSGIAMFGIIGWSVVIPILAGVMIGLWLDANHPLGNRSWTLMLIVAGLVIGCMNAWRWIAEENRHMHNEE